MKRILAFGRMMAVVALSLVSCTPSPDRQGLVVIDVHSKLNETRVTRVVKPESIEAIQ